ncbi:MAG TPA: MFS transporter, partial [Polyangiaceae bacterium]
SVGGASGSLRSIGRALRHRNYRLFFTGQSISLIGTWLTRVATSWLIYRLTNSALLLGVLGFAGQIPTFLLAPLAGVLVDRWDRYRVLVVTQVLAMVQSALLAVLALTGVIDVWHVLALSVFQGLINAFDMPARQSMVVQMVEDRADLPNAIALNSSMVNAARLVGPAVAGVLIAAVGEGWCFFVDAVSYVAVLVSLLLMRIPPRPRAAQSKRVLHEMQEGFAYAAGFMPIRAVLLLLAVVSLMGMPYSVLLPVIAREVLGGGAGTLGALTAASGLGALVGALYLASRRTVLGLGRVIVASAAIFGVGLVGFSRAGVLWLALPLMLVTGGGMMMQMASSNTILQTIVEEDKRGRVMSLFAMAFFGTAPLGSLLAGTLASRIGAQNTLLAGGVVCIAGAMAFLRVLPELRRQVQPIYVRMGILPEIAQGLQNAAQLTRPPET